jgi:hypothetical protein
MGRFTDIMRESADKTNDELDSDISSLTRLKDSEIARLAPTKADKVRLTELLDIVQRASTGNMQKAELQKKIAGYTDLIVGLVKTIAM